MDNDRKKIWLAVLIMAIISVIIIVWNVSTSTKPSDVKQTTETNVIEDVPQEGTASEPITLEPEEEGGHSVGLVVDPNDPNACPDGYVRYFMKEHAVDGTYFTVFALDCKLDAEDDTIVVVDPANEGEATFKAKVADAIPTDWQKKLVADKWVQLTGQVRYDAEADVVWLENAMLISISAVGDGDDSFQEAKTEYESNLGE